MDRIISDQAIEDMSAEQFEQFRAHYEKAVAPLREIRELVCKSMSIDPTPYAMEARVTASEARLLLHRMERHKPVAAQPPQ